MPIDHLALLAAVDAAKENSYGTDEHSSLSQRRAHAIEAYLGLNTNPAPEGRSQVVDRTVYQTISTIQPSLVRIFASSSESICKCVPVGPEDEAAAEQTTAVLNHVVTELNPWEQIVGDWMLDAAILPNSYAMAYWEDMAKTVQERYEGQSDDQIAALMQDTDVKILEHSTRPDTEGDAMALQQWQMMAAQAQQAGQPPPPKPPPMTLHDVLIERSETKQKVCIKVLPPEHCNVSADTPSWLLDDCPFFEYREQKTISQLRDMGLDVPEEISDNENDDTDEGFARDRFHEDRDFDERDGALRKVWARMTWITADCEGDGQARRYYCILVGRSVLYAEQCSRIQVSSMTMQPMPHRHPGMSIAETVMDLQDVKTAIKRGGLDNLYLANNGRHVVSSRVSLDDMLDSRPGGVVRLTDDGALPGDGHVMPLQHPFAFDSIIGSLEYFDQDAQNRSGASRYFAGTDAGAINKTASGTIALQNMAAMRVEHYARTIAPAIERLFSIVLELLQKHQNKPLAIKLRGQWVTVDPQAWRTKRDVRISVGVGAGNKDSMMQQLQQVLAAQMQIGLPLGLVAREQIQATNVEILKLAGHSNPEKFWPDPTRLPPPQPQPSPEQVKAQAEMQKAQFQAQQDAMRFQAEQQAKEREMALKTEMERSREEMQARQKALEAEHQAQIDQVKAQMQAQQEAARMSFDKWKAELDAAVKLQIAALSKPPEQAQEPDVRIDELLAGVQAIVEQIGAPVEIVRNPQTGRAEGVKRGSRVQRIVRGPDGRATGLQ